LKIERIAYYQLILKKGVPIMLLRNINASAGLCNGTRLIVKNLGERIIEAEIITGTNIGNCVFIPCIIMSSSGISWPFLLKRRQTPI